MEQDRAWMAMIRNRWENWWAGVLEQKWES